MKRVRILATADWQAGVSTVDLQDQEATWHQMVDIAIKHRVDLFLHGGDVVEGPTFTMEQLAAVRRVLARLREARIPVIMITGNSRHDLAVRPTHALDVFRDYEGIQVSDRPEVLTVAGVNIVTLPWVHPGRLLAQMNGAVDHDRANAAISDMLVRIVRDLKPDAHAVLVAHWAISGAKLPTGLGVEEMREPVLSWADLADIGYDAIIGAHIHEPQPLSDSWDKTLGFVAGSPQQLNHGEHGDHGCWLLEVGDHGPTDGRHIHAEFIPIDSPKFVTLDYENVAGCEFVAPIPDQGVEGDYVRVRYTATEDQATQFDHTEIRRLLLEAGARDVKIKPNILRQERARAPEISEALEMADALALWADANDVGADVRRRMIERLQQWRAA